ncbi:MAG: mannose-6-phosphate isomerase, partial [Opitutales bacterium]
QCVRRLAVQAGDSLLIHSGVMHAIDAGCLILEIQQNSDTTYRVSDWGRVGLDGRPRALHVRESLVSLAAAPAEPPRLLPAGGAASAVLADCAEFRISRHRLAAGGPLRFPAGEEPRLLSVVEGRLTAGPGAGLRTGDNVLLPFAGDFQFAAPAGAVVLVTDRFNHVRS